MRRRASRDTPNAGERRVNVLCLTNMYPTEPTSAGSAVLAAALTIVLGATDSLSPVVSLLILVTAGLLVFGGAVALFARPIIKPMWVSIRETRS
jgi:hypothetical protein